MSTEGVRPLAGPRGTDVLADLRRGRIKGEEARLRAASQLLEGFTYQELFKAMRDTIPEGGALPSSAGKEIFESLLDQHVAQAAAMGSERGLGSALYRHFAKAALSPGPIDTGSGPRSEDLEPAALTDLQRPEPQQIESDSSHDRAADNDLVDGTV